jgi:hypothetical protein
MANQYGQIDGFLGADGKRYRRISDETARKIRASSLLGHELPPMELDEVNTDENAGIPAGTEERNDG